MKILFVFFIKIHPIVHMFTQRYNVLLQLFRELKHAAEELWAGENWVGICQVSQSFSAK